MIINFVGNYQSGYVGEVADETHLAREMEKQGHTVRKIPRDEWREHVREDMPYPNVPKDLTADINIIAKWHQFYNESFIDRLRQESGAPVFYWVWDYMYDMGFPDWHLKMAKAADLYLTGEGGLATDYIDKGIKPYYFPFDVCDGDIHQENDILDTVYDVSFFGSYLGQGDRIKYLTAINEVVPIKIFSWNHEEWTKLGFDAQPAVYGADFNRHVMLSKVVLGLSVNPHCWGYWSNRMGKTLVAGSLLLQQYAPGMELFFGDNVEYFSSPDEAIDKIVYFGSHKTERDELVRRSHAFGIKNFTSAARVKQLMILAERFVKEQKGFLWNKLP